jgi:hypothetical protein
MRRKLAVRAVRGLAAVVLFFKASFLACRTVAVAARQACRTLGEYHVALVPRAVGHVGSDAAGAACAPLALLFSNIFLVLRARRCHASCCYVWKPPLAGLLCVRCVCVVPWRRGVVAAPGYRAAA